MVYYNHYNLYVLWIGIKRSTAASCGIYVFFGVSKSKHMFSEVVYFMGICLKMPSFQMSTSPGNAGVGISSFWGCHDGDPKLQASKRRMRFRRGRFMKFWVKRCQERISHVWINFLDFRVNSCGIIKML